MQNIVILAGNIGQPPEVRITPRRTKITQFTLTTSRPRLSEGRVVRDDKGFHVMDTGIEPDHLLQRPGEKLSPSTARRA